MEPAYENHHSELHDVGDLQEKLAPSYEHAHTSSPGLGGVKRGYMVEDGGAEAWLDPHQAELQISDGNCKLKPQQPAP